MVWSWIKAHAVVLVLGSVSLLLSLLWFMGVLRTGENPALAIKDKTDTLKFKHQVFRMTKMKGIEEATANVKTKYAADVAKMDEADKTKAEALASNPVALVDFIVATNRKSRAG